MIAVIDIYEVFQLRSYIRNKIQADVYLMFIRIKSGVKSLEIITSENVENPQ